MNSYNSYEVIVFDLVTCNKHIISLSYEALARILHFVIYVLFVSPASFRCRFLHNFLSPVLASKLLLWFLCLTDM